MCKEYFKTSRKDFHFYVDIVKLETLHVPTVDEWRTSSGMCNTTKIWAGLGHMFLVSGYPVRQRCVYRENIDSISTEKNYPSWATAGIKMKLVFSIVKHRRILLYLKSFNKKTTFDFGESLCSVVASVRDCGIIVSKFELQSTYYVNFRINTQGKGMKPLIFHS